MDDKYNQEIRLEGIGEMDGEKSRLEDNRQKYENNNPDSNGH
jgi:hypothetical protein